MSLQRRVFFAILGGCAVSVDELFAQHEHQTAQSGLDLAAYRPKALEPSEYQLLDELVETLLPADETGPGAHDAHVAYYIDVVLAHSHTATLDSWKDGLAGVEALAVQRFQKRFAACSDLQRNALFAELANNEMAPQTKLEHFFVELKRTAIDGFYASELIRHDYLGYRGNTAVSEFPGCTHANFEHPDLA